MPNPNIVDINAGSVEQTGFFCYMSKRKTEGYRQKLEWLKARFSEGMRIKMLELPERGFKSRVVELTSCKNVREKAPSPYGVFSIVRNGRLLAYHYLLPKDLKKALRGSARGHASSTTLQPRASARP